MFNFSVKIYQNVGGADLHLGLCYYNDTILNEGYITQYDSAV